MGHTDSAHWWKTVYRCAPFIRLVHDASHRSHALAQPAPSQESHLAVKEELANATARSQRLAEAAAATEQQNVQLAADLGAAQAQVRLRLRPGICRTLASCQHDTSLSTVRLRRFGCRMDRQRTLPSRWQGWPRRGLHSMCSSRPPLQKQLLPAIRCGAHCLSPDHLHACTHMVPYGPSASSRARAQQSESCMRFSLQVTQLQQAAAKGAAHTKALQAEHGSIQAALQAAQDDLQAQHDCNATAQSAARQAAAEQEAYVQMVCSS